MDGIRLSSMWSHYDWDWDFELVVFLIFKK